MNAPQHRRPWERWQECLYRQVAWGDLDPTWLRRLVALALEEDLAGGGFRQVPATAGDATSATLIAPGQGRAYVVARESMVVAGLPLLSLVSQAYGTDLRVEPQVEDGSAVTPGTVLAALEGERATMLTAERVMLNFLQRLSGVATETHRYVAALGNRTTRLLDTRKTTPGLRALEKYAVACGGGLNHRLGLYDRIMVKDNHLAASAAGRGERLCRAVHTVRQSRPDLPVEVEVDDLEQIPPVLEAGADVILLDNFSDAALREAVALIDRRAGTEASGGITLERLPQLATLGLDFVSTGATVHRARWVDVGLDWVE